MKKLITVLGILLLCAVFTFCSKTEHEQFSTIYGVVTDYDTSEPISGATVVLSPGGKTQTTGLDGSFEFVNLDPKQYTLTVQKSGYQTNNKSVKAVVDELRTEANITLKKTD
ncbi:MAG: carboxypeptidase-like regulatory domain-containing protein [Culturomica sp.]|jgi:hypothetical protein|nr:carboxypeptidase-like regulatory domain-containing protein [Culturomica sp.]